MTGDRTSVVRGAVTMTGDRTSAVRGAVTMTGDRTSVVRGAVTMTGSSEAFYRRAFGFCCCPAVCAAVRPSIIIRSSSTSTERPMASSCEMSRRW